MKYYPKKQINLYNRRISILLIDGGIVFRKLFNHEGMIIKRIHLLHGYIANVKSLHMNAVFLVQLMVEE